MNWQIVVGIFFLIGGFGNLLADFFNALITLLIGIALFYWGLRRKGYFKKTVTHEYEVDGCVLAYNYDDVKFYPPTGIVSKISKSKLQIGSELQLVQEPENSYDHAAVALYLDNQKIGYLLKNRLQDMANEYIAKGWPVKATLASLEKDKGEYHGYITLSYYKPGKPNNEE